LEHSIHSRFVAIVLSGLSLALLSAQSQAGKGFFDFNYYPYMTDVDGDNSITVNIAAKLPKRFSYFSLTNLRSDDSDSTLDELDTYYTEQNIRWQIAEDSPLDLTAQFNFRSGSDNDRHRLGVRWRLSNTPWLEQAFKAVHLNYAVNFHVLQFDHEDGDVWQIEHAFNMKFPYLTDRLYLAGFVDHTFNQDVPDALPKRPIVAEAQVGFQLVDKLYLISEYRLNQYRRSDVNNLAIGLQYKMTW